MSLPTPKQPKATKKVLHVWSGQYQPGRLHQSFSGDDWQQIRQDPDPKNRADIIAPITDLSMLADNQLDGIWAPNILQRLSSHQIGPLLSQWHRVLKPNGHLLLHVPDLQAAAAAIAAGDAEKKLYDAPLGVITAMDLIYGHRTELTKNHHNLRHRTGFTTGLLTKELNRASFSNLETRTEKFHIWASGYKSSHKASSTIDSELENPPGGAAHHPGFINSKLRTDELDIAPVHWQPLNLKETEERKLRQK